MHGDVVRLGKYVIKRRVRCTTFLTSLLDIYDIVRQDIHSEGLCTLSDLLTYTAEANDAKSLLPEFGTLKFFLLPLL